MLALHFDGTLKLVNDAPRPARAGEALIRVLAAGICNTDIEITRGYAAFNGIPGHEFVGVVEESPQAELIGKRVVGEINAGCGHCARCLAHDPRHCVARTVLGIVARDGAFAQYLSLPPANLLVVPDTVPDEQAVFTEPLAAACSILEQVSVKGARVAIIGDGKLGLLIAQVINLEECQSILIGKNAEKLALARRWGVRTAMVEDEVGGDFDIVVEASGAATGFLKAVDMVKPRGKIVMKSTYVEPLTFDASRVVVNEISVIGSRCGRFETALQLLSAGKIDTQSLINDVYTLKDGLAAFAHAEQRGVLKVLLKP